MKPTMLAFAVFLAVTMLAGGNARGETTTHGACMTANENNPFDGDFVTVVCWQYVLFPVGSALVVRCMDNITKLLIGVERKEGKEMSKEGLSLRTALDDTETPKWDWELDDRSGPNGIAMLITPAIPIIKEMLGHSRFRFRITEGNGEVHNGEIDISALGEAIRPVRALCGW